jgi:Mrp family chromosome partitioning ATPase
MSRGMIQGQDKDSLYTQLLDNAVESYLNDGIISDQEYRMVARFIQFSGVPQSTINANHALDKVVQAQVLGEIVNGKIPAQRFSVSGRFPFMLEKNEKVILVTSSIPKEGKSFVAGNLAVSLAFLGKKTLIVGMDIRKLS